MTIDDPGSVVTDPLPIARRAPETIREALRGTRHALFGIELTLLALLDVVFFGTSGLAGISAFVLGGFGLVIVLESFEA